MPQSLKTRFAPRLKHQQAEALYRRRPLAFNAQQPQMNLNGQNTLNFSSNDYLGLANHPKIKEAMQQALKTYGAGSGAAHLVTGHSLEHHLLEDELADWLGTERVLLFSTGYMANLAVQQTLMQTGDRIIGDKLNHASLIEGALHSESDFKRYPHRDMNALDKRLSQPLNQPNAVQLITTDGVFSMDGDLAPLPQIQTLAKNHQAWLFLDDAHGLGTLGEKGKGCFEYFNLKPDENTILMGTLGKAFGTSGAFVAGSETLIETLINFARPYIYTTAMSPIMAAAGRAALKQVQQGDHLRQHLNQLIQFFKQEATLLGLNLGDSPTAIQPILLGDAQTALNWSEFLKQQGTWVGAIRPPTVPKNTARLRMTLSASHTQTQVEQLLENLALCQQQSVK